MRKLMIRFLLLVFIFSLFITATAFGETEYRETSVVDYKGTVKVIISGGQKEYEPYKGMGLTQGDTIVTSSDSWMTFYIDDDKEIKLGENSRLTLSELSQYIDSQSESTGLSLWVGKLWINIKKKLNIRSKFEVKTGSTVMGVKGTKFYAGCQLEIREQEQGEVQVNQVQLRNNIRHLRRRSEIAVLEGTVSAAVAIPVEDEAGNVRFKKEIIDIHANERTVVDESQEDINVEKIILETLDLFVLEAIKEDPEGIDKELLEKLDRIIEEKKLKEEKEEELEDGEPEDGDSGDQTMYYEAEQATPTPALMQIPTRSSFTAPTPSPTAEPIPTAEPTPVVTLSPIHIGQVNDLTIVSGQTLEVSMNITPENALVSVETSNEDTAKVWISEGIVYVNGKNPGKAVITVTASKTGYSTAAKQFTVTVNEAEERYPAQVSTTPDKVHLDIDDGQYTSDTKIFTVTLPDGDTFIEGLENYMASTFITLGGVLNGNSVEKIVNVAGYPNKADIYINTSTYPSYYFVSSAGTGIITLSADLWSGVSPAYVTIDFSATVNSLYAYSTYETGQVNLNWKVPYGEHTIAVYASELSENEGFSLLADVSVNAEYGYAAVSGLTPGKKYWFKIVVTGGPCHGESNTVNVTLPAAGIIIGDIADMVLKIGKSDIRTLTPDPSDVTITAAAYDTGIVSVSVSGNSIDVKGLYYGTTVVKVTASRDGYETVEKQFQVTVNMDY